MIDLNYRKPEPVKKEQWEPEQIAMAVFASVLWIVIAFLFGIAL